MLQRPGRSWPCLPSPSRGAARRAGGAGARVHGLRRRASCTRRSPARRRCAAPADRRVQPLRPGTGRAAGRAGVQLRAGPRARHRRAAAARGTSWARASSATSPRACASSATSRGARARSASTGSRRARSPPTTRCAGPRLPCVKTAAPAGRHELDLPRPDLHRRHAEPRCRRPWSPTAIASAFLANLPGRFGDDPQSVRRGAGRRGRTRSSAFAAHTTEDDVLARADLPRARRPARHPDPRRHRLLRRRVARPVRDLPGGARAAAATCS